jgi:hypothetical protein
MQQQQSRLRIILGLVALVLVSMLLYSSAPRSVQAAGTGFTQTQAYSSNFPTTTMTADGVTQTTLTKIAFTVPSKGKMEVTAIFSIWIFYPANPNGYGFEDKFGNLSCSLILDGAPISSLSDTYNTYNAVSQEEGITKTSSIVAGSHTIALVCVALLNPLSDGTVLEMQATGRGMSALVLY